MVKLTKTITTTLNKVKGLMLNALRKGYTVYVYTAKGYISVIIHKGSPDDENYKVEAFYYCEYTLSPDPVEDRKRRSEEFISKIKNYIETDE